MYINFLLLKQLPVGLHDLSHFTTDNKAAGEVKVRIHRNLLQFVCKLETGECWRWRKVYWQLTNSSLCCYCWLSISGSSEASSCSPASPKCTAMQRPSALRYAHSCQIESGRESYTPPMAQPMRHRVHGDWSLFLSSSHHVLHYHINVKRPPICFYCSTAAIYSSPELMNGPSAVVFLEGSC